MRIIQLLKWKKVETWRLMYVWMTYVVPHLRYGALVFLPSENYGNGKLESHTQSFRKIYNEQVKKLFNLQKATPHKLIKKILGTWDAETIICQSYAKSANTWLETFEKDIEGYQKGGYEEKIIDKYGEMNKRLKFNTPMRLDKNTINEQINTLTYG